MALACRSLDPLGTINEVAGTRLHAEPVERGPTKRELGALAKVGGNVISLVLNVRCRAAFCLPFA